MANNSILLTKNNAKIIVKTGLNKNIIIAKTRRHIRLVRRISGGFGNNPPPKERLAILDNYR